MVERNIFSAEEKNADKRTSHCCNPFMDVSFEEAGYNVG